MRLAGMGTEHSLTIGRFQEAKFHWPFSGNESWKLKVVSVPEADRAGYGNRTIRNRFR